MAIVKVRLKDPSYTKDGQLYVNMDWLENWGEVEYKVIESCKHVYTICGECWGSWADDYHIKSDENNEVQA